MRGVVLYVYGALSYYRIRYKPYSELIEDCLDTLIVA